MAEFPETRESLVARVKDPGDGEAWARFVAVYRPAIYRLARKRGLQHSDAQDLTQLVLLAVAKAVERWEPDPDRGRFRAWLTRIARNAITNALTRARPDRGIGGTDLVDLLARHPDPSSSVCEDLDHEYQRAVFRWAQQRIRREFRPSTWEAFRRTTVDGTPQYMSPEQARGETVDHRSDLFSLGSVLYAMCIGRPPFRAETIFGVLRRISDPAPRHIREISPEIPDWLCTIIQRLQAKEPDQRFQSAEEVAELLAC